VSSERQRKRERERERERERQRERAVFDSLMRTQRVAAEQGRQCSAVLYRAADLESYR
jgi:hypothetical protein